MSLEKKLYSYKEVPFAEASTRGVLYKKVFLKISQNSQEKKENTCARVFFLIRLEASGLQLY